MHLRQALNRRDHDIEHLAHRQHRAQLHELGQGTAVYVFQHQEHDLLAVYQLGALVDDTHHVLVLNLLERRALPKKLLLLGGVGREMGE